MSNKEYYEKHRERIINKQREYYWKNQERYRKYQRDYKKRNYEKVKEQKRKYMKTPSGIWVKLGEKKRKERKISKEDFIKWYNSQKKQCVYCDIKEEEINDYKCWKGKRLQIDRKDSSKPYQKGNLVLACPVCNSVKGSYFTYKEMLEIGKVIRKKNKQKSWD